MNFAIVDLETTGRDAKEAHIVEWAIIVIEPEWFGTGFRMDVKTGLVRPPVHIPSEVSAIHHITDYDVHDAPTWEEAQANVLEHLTAGTIAVAHNANYEREMLASLKLPCKWLCTYKAAVRVWPDAPSFSNEGLRYHLGYGTGRKMRQEPHSAAHDAMVTANILHELLRAASIPDMLQWTDEPAMLPTCPLGDWRGKKWAEVEDSFLYWILRKITDREDVRFCAKKELDRREAERKAEYEADMKNQSKDAPF